MVYISSGRKKFEFSRCGIKLIKIKNKKSFKFINAITELRSIVVKERPRVVYSWLQKANILSFFCNFTFLSQNRYINIMSVRFGDIPEVNNLKKLIGLYLLKLAYKYSDGIIANSFQGKKNVLDKFNIDNSKIFVINNFIKPQKILMSNRDTNKNSKIIIGWVGRLNKYKSPFLIIDAISKMMSPNNYLISFFGKEQDISYNELMSYAEDKNIRIKIFGYVVEKEEIYNNIDILVSTSRTIEGSSNVALEALSFGIPVVLTDVGDNSIYCQQNRGTLVPISDANKLLQGIEKEINRDSDYLRISRVNFIEDNFSIDNMVSSYKKYFNGLLIA